MVVVSVVIEETKLSGKKVDFHIACNLLKREDAKDTEWQFAKALEATYLAMAKLIASDIVREEHID